MTTTPTPEAVERLIAEADSWNRCCPGNVNVEMLVRQMTDTLRALLARVDALTKERDQLRQARDDDGMQIMSLQAASGAVAEAMRKQDVAHVKHWWRELDDGGPVWEYLEDQPMVPTDAAAALAEDRKRVREDERALIAEFILRVPSEVSYRQEHAASIRSGKYVNNQHLDDVSAAILARKEDTDHDHR